MKQMSELTTEEIAANSDAILQALRNKYQNYLSPQQWFDMYAQKLLVVIP